MTPTETLKHEHQVILLALQGAEREADRLAEGFDLVSARVAQMVDFFRNFTDKCHHAKEEQHLFPRLEERGLPRTGGPIGVMLHEHEVGRAHVSAVAEAIPPAESGQAQARSSLQDNLAAYVALLRAHIDKEDNVLFPMADQLLTAADQKELTEAFEKVEAEEIGEGVHDKYHQLAHELAEG